LLEICVHMPPLVARAIKVLLYLFYAFLYPIEFFLVALEFVIL
jgi:hypothetical protein